MRSLRSIIAVLLFAAPLVAFAQTSSGTDLTSLMSELSALEQQLSLLSASSTSTTPAPAASTGPATATQCPLLSRTLSIGMSGTDVLSLQEFLTQQRFFATQATGYFGPVTLAAVTSWQLSKGVISADTQDAGAGIVGPRTRAAIAQACSGTVSSAPTQCLAVLPPTTECPTGWQPVADANGCTEYYQCTIQLPLQNSATTTAATSSASSSTACPVVQKPTCSGQVVPFQTNSNGCVTAYECEL